MIRWDEKGYQYDTRITFRVLPNPSPNITKDRASLGTLTGQKRGAGYISQESTAEAPLSVPLHVGSQRDISVLRPFYAGLVRRDGHGHQHNTCTEGPTSPPCTVVSVSGT